MKKQRYELDMTKGAILPLVLQFAIPIALADMLQLLYNAADVAVVGRFASSEALAAVSATSTIINLLTQVFIGFSLGSSVLVSRAYGVKDEKSLGEFVHTSITLALICGAAVTIVGIALGRSILQWMNTPAEVLELAASYLAIYFSGTIFSMLYNYGAAVMRAVGDARRPTQYLILSGAVNVTLNVLFVVVFHMSVVGVALATVLSQLLSAALVVNSLMRSESAIRLDPRKLRIIPGQLVEQMRIGLPVGVQRSMFSISNIILQTAVNGFGAVTMAGSGAASNIESFVYAGLSCFYSANLTFTGQNMGARNIDRVKKIIPVCIGCTMAAVLVLGGGVLLFSKQVLGIYSPDPEVVAMGVQRLHATILPYVFVGMADAFVANMRAMGKALWPMLIAIVGICGLRILWVSFVFPLAPSLYMLYLSYPVSWGTTMLGQCICCMIVRKKVFAELCASGGEQCA